MGQLSNSRPQGGIKLMFKRSVTFGLIITLSIVLKCGIFEPEEPQGSLAIILKNNSENSLPKAEATSSHDAVQCIVKKGSQTVFDENLTKKAGGGFHGEIKDLEPANNYSVLLYGKNNSSAIISRAYKSGISVSAGKQTSVTLSWSPFTPALISPANGSSTSDTTPTFNWSAVSGVNFYELEVDTISAC
jgi:hypothetical protein